MGADADILICGNCHQDFLLDNLSAFMAHKKFDCDIIDQSQLALFCQSCEGTFTSPWQLLQHAQLVHAIQLYQDNRLIKQPDKTATFTAAQSYVQANYEDGRLRFVTEYKPQKPQKPQTLEEDDSYNNNDKSSPKREVESGKQASEQNVGHDQAKTSDAATQVDDPEDERNDDDGSYCCCSNQNCGVTVMPGTHERLLECCNAVVPKKRKRHMETKHIPTTLLRRKKLFEGTKVVRNTNTGDIYIDVETSGPSGVSDQRERRMQEQKGTKSKSANGSTSSRDLPQRPLSGSKQKSVIIQPGTTFSIPVSYAVVQQPIVHTKTKSVGVGPQNSPIPTRPPLSSFSAVRDSPPAALLESTPIAIPMKSSSEPADKSQNNHQVNLSPTAVSLPQNNPVGSNLNQVPVVEQSHPVPLIASQLFGLHQGVSTASNDADKDNAVIDQTTQFLSLIMSVNNDGVTKDIQIPVIGSDAGFGSNLVIDHVDGSEQLEVETRLADASGSSENHTFVGVTDNSNAVTSENASGDSSASCEPKLELTLSDGDASQGSDFKNMKKRRYPTSRPFKCDQCSQAFNQRIHLRKHQSKHTGIKPFKCGQCDYSTVERSHLKVHIRVHTGEKPYKCTYCEYATAQNSTLKIHLKRHHDGGEGSSGLSCRTCGKKFKQQENLEVHYRQHSSADDH